MNDPFDLVEQPWIPVIELNGKLVELGLRQTLMRAHELRGITADSALEEATLHRLLLVILHRVFGPASRREWVRLWNRRSSGFDAQKLDGYWKEWQQEKRRFMLYDPVHPFFQVPTEEGLTKGEINKMITRLTMDATIFQHTLNHPVRGAALTPAEAARALVAIQSYGLGYNVFVDAPLTKGAVFIVQGSTLFETLMLNLIRYPQESGDWGSTDDDRPAWEHDNVFAPEIGGEKQSRDVYEVERSDGKRKKQYDKQPRLGHLDQLTWQNRKIKLLPGSDGLVRQVAWHAGLRIADDIPDPMLTYYANEKEGWDPVRIAPGRALWRDIETLLQLAPDEKRTRPIAALRELAEIARNEEVQLPRAYRLNAYGLAKNKARLEFMARESTPLRIEYLTDETLAPRVRQALALVESVGRHVVRCAFLLAWLVYDPGAEDSQFKDSPETTAEGAGKRGRRTRRKAKAEPLSAEDKIEAKLRNGKSDGSRDLDAQRSYQLYASFGIERLYWASLEPLFFRFIVDLPDRPEEAEQEWCQQVLRAARAAFRRVEDFAGADRRTVRAAAEAGTLFESYMRRLENQTDTTRGGETDAAK